MARCAFVQIQRFHARRRARGQVIGVEIEDAGPRLRRVLRIPVAGFIGSARLVLFAVRFVEANLERGLRDRRELAGDHGVDALADRIIAIDQRLLRCRLELRVGAQMLEKFLQRALEPDLGLDRFHLAVDPRHFGQAQLVDIIGGQRQRRQFLDRRPVQDVATLHARNSHLFARDGQIFVLQEIAQPDIGRLDLIADHRLIFGGQALAISGGDRVGEFLDRAIEHRTLNPLLDLRVELADHVVDGHLRLDDARLHALAEPADRPIDQRHIVLVALQIILVIGQRLERCRPLARGEGRVEGVKAREMVDRAHRGQCEHFGRKPFQPQLCLPFEHVIGDLVGGVERRAVDRVEALQLVLGRGALGVEIGI